MCLDLYSHAAWIIFQMNYIFSLTSQYLHFSDSISVCSSPVGVSVSLFKVGSCKFKRYWVNPRIFSIKDNGLIQSFILQFLLWKCRSFWLLSPLGKLQRYAVGKLTFEEAVWGLAVPLTLSLQITPLFLNIVVKQLNINV